MNSKESKKSISLTVVISLVFLLLSTFIFAQEKPIEEMSLEELLNMEITVASIRAMTLRESPGIITVITKEEIVNSGARDLIDVLRLVAGIEFGIDVAGVVSMGIRGKWAQEGKVLLLWDGQEMNELLYGSLQLGNHYPIDQIKKIEIIRGPGSAIYGGFAELAVINVITENADEVNGVKGSIIYGQMSDTFARRNINISYGRRYENGLSLRASLFMGQGTRSDQQFTDMKGNTFDMAGNSELNPFNINLALNYKGVNAQMLIDRYHTTTRDGYEIVNPKAVDMDFYSYFFDLNYDYKINDKLTLTPRFKYKRQLPWRELPSDAPILPYNRVVERYLQNLTLSYDPVETLNIITGIEYYADYAKDKLEGSSFPDGKKKVSYNNIAGYLQGIFILPTANITVGARYENHSAYGASFVPRLGITRATDKFHFKLLGSRAFRAPTIENIALGENIEPEKTQTLEFEAGYQIDKDTSVIANIFDIAINKPIVYFYDPIADKEKYINADEIKTRGLELEYRLRRKWGYLNMNYSYYTVVENKVEKYAVPVNNNVLLGFPAHKITLNTALKLRENIILNPTISYISERYGYHMKDENDNPLIKKFDPAFLANLYLNYNISENFNIGVGIYDILNTKYEFIQPHNSGHAPLPGPSREIVLKLSYKY